jgi:DnaK suppressor protein
MDKAKLDELRAELIEDRRGQLEFLEEHGADPYGEEVRDLGVGNDGFADSAQATEERSEILGHIETARHRVHLIDDALQRIDEGAYGVCADCGAQIDEARLEVRPLSIRCVSCAEKAA